MFVLKNNYLKSFVSIFREYSVISPQKISLAIINTVIILRVLELGGSSLSVSIILSLDIFSTLFISTLAPKILNSYKKIKFSLVLFYIVMSLSIFLMHISNLSILYISSAILFLSSQIIYYATYMSINLNGYRDKSIFLSKLAMIGGFSWIGGLIIGSLFTSFLDLSYIIKIVSFIPLIGFLYSLFNLHKERFLSTRTVSIFKKDLNKKVILKSSLPTMNSIKVFTNIRRIFPVRIKYLLLTVLLTQLSISFAFTHLIPYVIVEGFTYSEVFILSLFSSILSSFTYLKAGNEYRGRSSLIKAMGYRLLAYITFITLIISGLLFYNVYGFVFNAIIFILIGISWGYLYINLSSIILHLNKRDMSYANLVGGIGNIIGVFLSGMLFLNIPYQIQLSFSAIILSIAILIVMKKPILRNKKIPIIPISIIIQSVSRANETYKKSSSLTYTK